jgi:hypothetical protein
MKNGAGDEDFQWRRLALQFDGHRMEALWHLKALINDPSHAEKAKAFLAAGPISGEVVLANRLAEMAKQYAAEGVCDAER